MDPILPRRLESDEAFHFTSIPRNSFRLFHLLPSAEPDAAVQCEIVITSLEDKSALPPYKAISYTWANPEFVWTWISVNNGWHRIPENLRDALISLRLKDQECLMWADAICINFEDAEECNHQISLMREVFSNTWMVCVWLCNESSRTNVALDFIQRLSKYDSADIALSSNYNEDWQAVDELFSLNWFHRVWVVQEVAVARSITVYCGSRAVGWSDIEACVDLVHYARQVLENHQHLPDPKKSRLVDTIRGIYHRDELGNVLEPLLSTEELIVSTPQLKSTNPRDRIYALLPLANDKPIATDTQSTAFAGTTLTEEASNISIRFDYQKPVAEVFTDFIRFTITQSGSLDIIFKPWAPSDHSLPSWICTADRLTWQHPFASFSLQQLAYAASGKSKVQDGWSIEVDSLHVAGVVIGKLQVIQESAMKDSIPFEWFEWILSRNEDLKSFCHTLVAGRTMQGNQFPPYYLKVLSSFMASTKFSATSFNLASLVQENLGSVQNEFWRQVHKVTRNRALAATSDGRLGLVPAQAKPGDLICILFGCSVPVVLRQYDTPKYTLVGECYMHGIMDGETVKSVQQEDSLLRLWFDIEPHRLDINIESVQVVGSKAFLNIRSIMEYPEPQGLKKQPSFPLSARTKAPINFTQQAATASTKPEFDIFPSQFRLHWTCNCGYRGYSEHTEFEPGVVQELADGLVEADFKVSLERLGLEDPAVTKIRLLWTDLGIFFGNTVAEFQLFLWGHPRSNRNGSTIRITEKPAAIDTEGIVASEEGQQSSFEEATSEISSGHATSGVGTSRPVTSTQGRTVTSPSEQQLQQPAAAHTRARNNPTSTSGASAVSLQQLPSVAVAASPRPPTPEPLPRLWLLLCMDNKRWPYIRDPVDVTNIGYDQSLFTVIQQRHVARREPGIKWRLGLWRPLLISYVKFTLHAGENISRLQPNSLPPRHMHYYEFQPKRFSSPPNDSEIMVHFYLYPERSENSRYFRAQVAKRKDRVPEMDVPPDVDTAWGLYIKDGVYVKRVAQLGLVSSVIIFLIGLIIGLACYITSPKNMTLNWLLAMLNSVAAASLTVVGVIVVIATS